MGNYPIASPFELKPYKKNKAEVLHWVKSKYGYLKIRLSKKEKNYIFKTSNLKGIESRFIEIVHRKLNSYPYGRT